MTESRNRETTSAEDGELPAGQSGTAGFAITECWLFVAVGGDGEEGVMAFQSGGTWMPMVAADRRRYEMLAAQAPHIAAAAGIREWRVKHMRLVED